jgi:hypothetical protein
MTCTMVEKGESVVMRVELYYGGTLWTGGILERVLADHIERGRENLRALVSPGGR